MVTFNVERAPDVAELARAIVSSPVLSRAHIFLLQEMEHHATEPGSRTRMLVDRLGGDLGHVYAPARQVARDATHGLAVVSRPRRWATPPT